MKVIVDFCIVPIGVGVSVSTYIAACQLIFKKAGLKTQMHAYGTNLEGDWDTVFEAIKDCYERVHEMGAPRITATIKLGTRIDREQTMEEKVQSVLDKLEYGIAHFLKLNNKATMKYKAFGDTGIQVSEIGFGAWGIGGTPKDARAYGPTDDNVSRAALRRAFEKGVTFYDTSPLYGYGHSEELIGTTLKEVRQDIVIASKVGFVNFNGEQNFSPEYIRSSLESSLKRLQTDYIDIFQLHDPSMTLLQEDHRIIKTLESLKQEGKIRIIGISTKSPEESLIAIEQFNVKGIQVNFNLIDQRALDNGLFKKCEELGVGIIGRTPLCFGFLTGQYSANDNYDASDHRSLWSREQVDRWANAYKLFSKEFTSLKEQNNTQIALRYCLSYPMLSTTIPGMLTEEHVDENTRSSDLGAFPPSILEKCNQIYQNNEFFVRPTSS